VSSLVEKPQIYVASKEEIKKGLTADVYFKRTVDVLEKMGLCDVWVRAELHSYSFPKGYQWAVFAGLEEALWLLEGYEVNVYSLPEGTIFYPKEPVMVIEGPYCVFAMLETALLGILRHATSIATKAARIKLAAGDKKVYFFGLRALHPAIAPMADRAAYIGGVDGVAGLAAEKYLGVKPVGTMPHAFIIVVGDPVKAWKAFDKYLDESIPRIALVDTFYDERYESVLAFRALGEKLYGVRLDTPKSRRGDMRSLVEEVRWALDLEGGKHVKIFVSGGLDEEEICRLRDIVDGFGVGSSIAFPPSIDISMDIVEVKRGEKWEKIAKRGKLPGAKTVYACNNIVNHVVVLWGSKPPRTCRNPRQMLVEYIREGKLVRRLPSLDEIRKYVFEQLEQLDPSLKSVCSAESKH